MCIVHQSFKRLHCPVDVILLCLRWYLAYSFSLRNLEKMMLERGIIVDHSTCTVTWLWFYNHERPHAVSGVKPQLIAN